MLNLSFLFHFSNKRSQTQCDNTPRKHAKVFEDTLVLCCHEDMCNGHDQKKMQPNLTTDADGIYLYLFNENV